MALSIEQSRQALAYAEAELAAAIAAGDTRRGVGAFRLRSDARRALADAIDRCTRERAEDDAAAARRTEALGDLGVWPEVCDVW